jgi:hypothetical protein
VRQKPLTDKAIQSMANPTFTVTSFLLHTVVALLLLVVFPLPSVTSSPLLSDKELEECIKAIVNHDQNGDGILTLDEFLLLCENEAHKTPIQLFTTESEIHHLFADQSSGFLPLIDQTFLALRNYQARATHKSDVEEGIDISSASDFAQASAEEKAAIVVLCEETHTIIDEVLERQAAIADAKGTVTTREGPYRGEKRSSKDGLVQDRQGGNGGGRPQKNETASGGMGGSGNHGNNGNRTDGNNALKIKSAFVLSNTQGIKAKDVESKWLESLTKAFQDAIAAEGFVALILEKLGADDQDGPGSNGSEGKGQGGNEGRRLLEHSSFTRFYPHTSPQMRRRLQEIDIVAASTEIKKVKDINCPESVSDSSAICQTVHIAYDAVGDNSIPKQRLYRAIFNATQERIEGGDLQDQLPSDSPFKVEGAAKIRGRKPVLVNSNFVISSPGGRTADELKDSGDLEPLRDALKKVVKKVATDLGATETTTEAESLLEGDSQGNDNGPGGSNGNMPLDNSTDVGGPGGTGKPQSGGPDGRPQGSGGPGGSNSTGPGAIANTTDSPGENGGGHQGGGGPQGGGPGGGQGGNDGNLTGNPGGPNDNVPGNSNDNKPGEGGTGTNGNMTQGGGPEGGGPTGGPQGLGQGGPDSNNGNLTGMEGGPNSSSPCGINSKNLEENAGTCVPGASVNMTQGGGPLGGGPDGGPQGPGQGGPGQGGPGQGGPGGDDGNLIGIPEGPNGSGQGGSNDSNPGENSNTTVGPDAGGIATQDGGPQGAGPQGDGGGENSGRPSLRRELSREKVEMKVTLRDLEKLQNFSDVGFDTESVQIYDLKDTPCDTAIAVVSKQEESTDKCITVFGKYRVYAEEDAELEEVYSGFRTATQDSISDGSLEAVLEETSTNVTFKVEGASSLVDDSFNAFSEIESDEVTSSTPSSNESGPQATSPPSVPTFVNETEGGTESGDSSGCRSERYFAVSSFFAATWLFGAVAAIVFC